VPSHLHVGQRVAALHELGAAYGAFAEYALVKSFAVLPLPDNVTFEEAVTLPMAVAVAGVGLFAADCLGVRQEPWRQAVVQSERSALLIYGGATQVGAMAIKLARLAGVGPIFCVAGRGGDFVQGLLDETAGDRLFDYRDGDDALVQAFREALGDRKCIHAFDAVSGGSSYTNIAKVLSPGGRLAMVLPGKLDEAGLEGVAVSYAMAGSLWKRLQPRVREGGEGKHVANLGIVEGGPEFAQELSLHVAELLRQKKLQGHPYELHAGGLAGLEGALQALRAGQNSAVKYVVRVSETPGIESR
jgi:NADPH:quinone reductase